MFLKVKILNFSSIYLEEKWEDEKRMSNNIWFVIKICKGYF